MGEGREGGLSDSIAVRRIFVQRLRYVLHSINETATRHLHLRCSKCVLSFMQLGVQAWTCWDRVFRFDRTSLRETRL